MSEITQLIQFEDAEIRVYDLNGERWVTAKELAGALGYADPRTFRDLVQEMADRGELKKGGHFNLLPLQTAGGKQETVVLSYRGVIRTAMRSDAPNAVAFRDWAEEVLFQVMVTGSYSKHTWRTAHGGAPHWTDQLSPSERLDLAKLRVECRWRLADRPDDRHLWAAYWDTFGDLPRDYLEDAKDYLWENRRLGREVSLERLDPLRTPEERGY
ncbi:MAG: Bro-N domain-containing protein [Thermodesulfobacteriota bacterium]